MGNPQEITVLKLAQIVAKLTETSSTFIYKQIPIDDPIRRRPDISKAKKLMDWNPKVPLYEGLNSTLEYFQSERPLIKNAPDDAK